MLTAFWLFGCWRPGCLREGSFSSTPGELVGGGCWESTRSHAVLSRIHRGQRIVRGLLHRRLSNLNPSPGTGLDSTTVSLGSDGGQAGAAPLPPHGGGKELSSTSQLGDWGSSAPSVGPPGPCSPRLPGQVTCIQAEKAAGSELTPAGPWIPYSRSGVPSSRDALHPTTAPGGAPLRLGSEPSGPRQTARPAPKGAAGENGGGRELGILRCLLRLHLP